MVIATSSSAGGRIAVDGISYYSPSYDVRYQNAKLLGLGHYRQSTNYTCGPAAIMNLLYYHKMISAGDLNRQTEMRIAYEMGTTSSGGTSQEDVEAWLSKHGFSVTSGTFITSDALIKNINAGIPTIIIFDRHWMLAGGYSNKDSDSDNDIIFNDTASGITVIPREYIDTMWARFQLSHANKLGNPGYYIIAVPNHR